MIDRDTLDLTRLYADESGESRFGTMPWPMIRRDFAPPAAPFLVSEPQAAEHLVFIEFPIGWDGAVAHPVPGRHLFVCLCGSIAVTASSGEARRLAAGDAILVEDTFGRGHRTVVTSPEAVRAVMIRLP